MRSRLAWGYISDISGTKSENARTPRLLTDVAHIAYLREGEKEFSFLWARVLTSTSNCLTPTGASVMEGTPSAGALMATFGDYADASLQKWKPSSISAWRREGMWPPVVSSDHDPDPWPWAPLPTIGDALYYAKKKNPNYGD